MAVYPAEFPVLSVEEADLPHLQQERRSGHVPGRAAAFGGGSFEDLTRIAMINAPLWTELFSANKTELLSHMDSFLKSFTDIRECLEKNDLERLCKILEEVRVKRIAMSRIESGL